MRYTEHARAGDGSSIESRTSYTVDATSTVTGSTSSRYSEPGGSDEAECGAEAVYGGE